MHHDLGHLGQGQPAGPAGAQPPRLADQPGRVQAADAMGETATATGQAPVVRRRAPLGASAALVAAVLAVPVVFFDAWEGLMQRLGIDGGLPVLLLLVAVFALLWAVGAAILAWASPAPAREGLAAGCLVAAVMAVVLVMVGRTLDGSLVPLALVWALFAALAVGLGALTGMAAGRIQDRLAPGRGVVGRAPAVVAVACGAVLLLAAVPFLSGTRPSTGAGAAALWMVVGLSALLVAGGLWSWRRPC